MHTSCGDIYGYEKFSNFLPPKSLVPETPAQPRFFAQIAALAAGFPFQPWLFDAWLAASNAEHAAFLIKMKLDAKTGRLNPIGLILLSRGQILHAGASSQV